MNVSTYLLTPAVVLVTTAFHIILYISKLLNLSSVVNVTICRAPRLYPLRYIHSVRTHAHTYIIYIYRTNQNFHSITLKSTHLCVSLYLRTRGIHQLSAVQKRCFVLIFAIGVNVLFVCELHYKQFD